MALADRIFATTRELDAAVRINGVLIAQNDPTSSTGVPGWSSLAVSKTFDSPVPTLSLEVNRIPVWVKRGQLVTVDLGYDGYTQRVFTGYVQDRSRCIGRGTIHCMGKLSSAFQTVEIPERDVDGLTVEAALEAILDYVDITDRVVDVPAFTLGTASDPTLERMTCAQQLQMLMDIDGCRIWELGSGVVYVKQVDEMPAPTSFRTYTTSATGTARLLEGCDQEDPEYLRTRVVVVGATVVEGVAPNQTSRTITATAVLVGSDLVQPPLPAGTYRDCEFNNHLIDTDAKAAEVVTRVLTKYARVPRSLSIEIGGDPQIELGMTITLDIPELDTSDRWFVYGVQHSVSLQGYKTRLDLRGGGEYGGTIKLYPIAAFTYDIDREVITDAVYVVATFNASGSFDPDGTIASYAWSDNIATTPEIVTLTDAIITVRVPAASASGWQVTLTVTDNDGLTAAYTADVNTEVGEENVTVPAIFAALNTDASGSPDGGITWNDEIGSSCISVGAKPPDGINSGIACYGYTDGRIKRTTDFAQSLTTVLAADPANGEIRHIKWDMNAPQRVWAVTSTGRVLVSTDDGLTFSVYKDFGNAYPLNRLLNPSTGGIIVFGGRGDDTTTLIQYDIMLDGNWQSQAIGGEFLADLAGAGSGVTVADGNSMFPSELVVITKGLPSGTASIYTTAALYGDGADWLRGTGLDLSTEGRFVVSDWLSAEYHAAFDDRNVWHSTDRVAWTKTADVFPANGQPNHAVWTGEHGIAELAGCYLAAVEDMAAQGFGIYKTTDGFRTALALRPATGYPAWPAGARGKMVVLGAPGESIMGDVVLAAEPDNDGSTDICLLQGGSWALKATIASEYTGPLQKLGSYYWLLDAFVLDSTDPKTAKRSADLVTWTDKCTTTRAMAIAADGRLWRSRKEAGVVWDPEYYIEYSIDDGDSWVLSETILPGAPFGNYGVGIACHPTDKNMVVVLVHRGNTGDVAIDVTTDQGASWSGLVTLAGAATQGTSRWNDIKILQNGRVVTTHSHGADQDIWYSDTPTVAGSWVHQSPVGALDTVFQLYESMFRIYSIGIGKVIKTTGDSAVSWDDLSDPFLEQPANKACRAILHESRSDRLYAATAFNRSSNIIHLLTNPLDPSSSWIDVTGNLLSVQAATNTRPLDRGMCPV